MDYDYKVTKKAGSLYDDDQEGHKFVDEEDEILNEYTRSFSFQAPEEVEDRLFDQRESNHSAQDVGESDSDSDEDEEDYEQPLEEPTLASEEAIKALEILTLEAPEQCAICVYHSPCG
ncbi:hypothetical protein RHSIM_Rhsim07G0220300 [Rhododendron simsii]|uniref:Uncharacterized protein n=1 Tax=Rhododendron simsii TaxID=118357 RepID=A0A834LL63_RHOSS|nr:hypothetical protein RHSIM_Rhsim07G0220300 [Rhododendron simsii]